MAAREKLEARVLGPFVRRGRLLTPSAAAWDVRGLTLATLEDREDLALGQVRRSFAFDILLAYSCRERGMVLVTRIRSLTARAVSEQNSGTMDMVEILERCEGKTLGFERELTSPGAKMGRFDHGEAFNEEPMSDLDSEAVAFRVASESFEDAIAFIEKHTRLDGRGLLREIGTSPKDPRRRYFVADREQA